MPTSPYLGRVSRRAGLRSPASRRVRAVAEFGRRDCREIAANTLGHHFLAAEIAARLLRPRSVTAVECRLFDRLFRRRSLYASADGMLVGRLIHRGVRAVAEFGRRDCREIAASTLRHHFLAAEIAARLLRPRSVTAVECRLFDRLFGRRSLYASADGMLVGRFCQRLADRRCCDCRLSLL